ncbi:hypothetical protein [Gaoshiqia sp. Z1-71]|uniref:hypothetical protein n=1 Tax=Gaoshiqia hydrogeniformans TaxID=3290090 RepID=UPI003BF90ECD
MRKGYYYRRSSDGCTYRYRMSTNGLDVDVKLNDAFARLAGHTDLGDFLSNDNCLGFEKLLERFGEIPKYLPLRINGQESDIVSEGKRLMQFYGVPYE